MATITRYRGDTVADTIAVQDESGDAINVTGYTFLMTIDPAKAPADDTDNILQLTGAVVDGPGGLVAFAPTELESEALVPGKYWYDIQMDDGSSITTLALDRYVVVQDITK